MVARFSQFILFFALAFSIPSTHADEPVYLKIKGTFIKTIAPNSSEIIKRIDRVKQQQQLNSKPNHPIQIVQDASNLNVLLDLKKNGYEIKYDFNCHLEIKGDQISRSLEWQPSTLLDTVSPANNQVVTYGNDEYFLYVKEKYRQCLHSPNLIIEPIDDEYEPPRPESCDALYFWLYNCALDINENEFEITNEENGKTRVTYRSTKSFFVYTELNGQRVVELEHNAANTPNINTQYKFNTSSNAPILIPNQIIITTDDGKEVTTITYGSIEIAPNGDGLFEFPADLLKNAKIQDIR
ncbi:MAG: hypothetical protein GC154_10745 [bacterium]|nr:hypothetical protein [bacterium]